MTTTALLLLAAGQSERMGENKLVMELSGQSVIERALTAALDAREVSQIIIVVCDQTRPIAQRLSLRYKAKPIVVVSGGNTRQESVYNGLLEAKGFAFVAIHDAARCLITPAIIDASVVSARRFGSGVVALAAQDTIKQVKDGFIIKTLDRSELVQIQTPQTFEYSVIMRAHESAIQGGALATDDAALVERLGIRPRIVPGSAENIKLTTQDDIGIALGILARRGETVTEARAPAGLRAGFGEDTHRIVEGRALILGGVDIPFEKGLLGHSDADALTHAVMDALLGAAGLPDIGELFPDNETRYEGIRSLELLESVANMLEAKRFRVCNVDCVITAQNPRLAPYKERMRQALSVAMRVSASRVNVKATTTEGLGKEGRGEAISARALALLEES